MTQGARQRRWYVGLTEAQREARRASQCSTAYRETRRIKYRRTHAPLTPEQRHENAVAAGLASYRSWLGGLDPSHGFYGEAQQMLAVWDSVERGETTWMAQVDALVTDFDTLVHEQLRKAAAHC